MEKSAAEDIAECYAEDIRKIRATYVPAEILDADSRVLATGEAAPMDDGASPVFHVHDRKEKDVDALASRASSLRRSDGTIQKILNCRPCRIANDTPHFHLEIQT